MIKNPSPHVAITKVNVWKTADGRLFEDEVEGRWHDVKLRLFASMEQIPMREPDRQDILEWVVDNAILIHEALAYGRKA